MAAHRLRRYSSAEACFFLFAVLLIGSLGTGLGLAAARLQDESSASHPPIHKIVRPFDESPPVLNRDRTRLDR
ncbi:MAG TPA: hypothetical protein VGJ77_00070 [Gaiellaceae bacterium]